MVTLEHEAIVGRGECTPYARFGESVEGVVEAIAELPMPLDHHRLADLLPPGGARCAVDNALWDLLAQRTRRPVHELADLPAPSPVVTAYTLSVDTEERMASLAAKHAHRAWLKVKLDDDLDASRRRLAAVHDAAPDAQLIVDPNGSWSRTTYDALAPDLVSFGVALLEQPFGSDDAPLCSERPVAVAADEACRQLEQIETLVDRYDAVNIKLDKAGGLTQGIAWADAADASGLRIMVGCHVCTSLSLAPALLLASRAQFVDLDAGLLLARDREGGAIYEGSTVAPGSLWGFPRGRES